MCDLLDTDAGPHGVERHARDGGGHEHEHVGEGAFGARHRQPQEDARADEHAKASDEQEVLHLRVFNRVKITKCRAQGPSAKEGSRPSIKTACFSHKRRI